MGYLAEKYDSAYFLRRDHEGNQLNYGVEGVEAFLKGDLREHDKEILRHVRFLGANVLEFGFGRGETIKHIWDAGAKSYIGVDFSAAACAIATEFLAKFTISGPKIFCADALEFVRDYTEEHRSLMASPIDVVVMLDFVEHVPRTELREILQTLKAILSPQAVIVVNTPDFTVDNDVIADGLDERVRDSSDALEETRGMHCNRYSLESLRQFFRDTGYQPVSRGHYFVLTATLDDKSRWQGDGSYRRLWDNARARGARLQGEWPHESFEVAYDVKEFPSLYRFEQGSLEGLAIYVIPSYLEYYPQGDYDSFLIDYLAQFDLAGKAIFDLGAFVGVNSMQFARLVGPNGEVCAFEPNPFNADRLKLNLSENPDLHDRIQIFPLAVGDAPGRCKFYVHHNVDEGTSSASYLDGARATLSCDSQTALGFTEVDVDLVTLDQFVQETGISPACIKIDIEGSEHLALAGAINVLRQHRPVLLIELHSIFCALTTLEIVTSIGYETSLLHVEQDGRCFIGASFAATAEQVGGGVAATKNQEDKPLKTHSDLELPLVKKQLDASRRTVNVLNAELTTVCAEREELNAELTTVCAERDKLATTLAHMQEQCSTLGSQLNEQRQINDVVSSRLLRYQMFPPIRIARRIARIFR